MAKRIGNRFWQIGCLGTILVAMAIFIWVVGSTSQIPTTSIITQRAVLVLHGPLNPNDEGIKAAWDALIAKWRSENVPAWRVLVWLGIPRELTVVIYDAQPSPLSVVAVNFRKGFRWLWLPLRIFGKDYKGAYYLPSHHFVAGMIGGTVIFAEDEVTFCYAVDNLMSASKSEKLNLKLMHKFRNLCDFVGFVNPQLLSAKEHIQLPANLGEIGIDIVDASELVWSVFWICQSEREVKAMMYASEKFEKEEAETWTRKGAQVSFRKQSKGLFVWWEFRLKNFMALLP